MSTKEYAAWMAEKVDGILSGEEFLLRCRAAGVQATRRQARKFLRKEGRARQTAKDPNGSWVSFQ